MLRLQLFKLEVENLLKDGVDIGSKEGFQQVRDIRKGIDIFSRRGSIQAHKFPGEAAMKAAGVIQFGPRYRLGNMQMITTVPVAGAKSVANAVKRIADPSIPVDRASREYLKTAAASVASATIVTGLAYKALKDIDPKTSIELDPDNTDFLRVNFRDKHYDFTFGASTAIRAIARGIMNSKQSRAGNVTALSPYSGPGGIVPLAQAATDYAITGLSPAANAYERIMAGRTKGGRTGGKQEPTAEAVMSILSDLVVPISSGDVVDSAIKSAKSGDSALVGALLALPSVAGAGVSFDVDKTEGYHTPRYKGWRPERQPRTRTRTRTRSRR
jgi:hypothetical protein